MATQKPQSNRNLTAWELYQDYFAGARYMVELIHSGVARGFYSRDLADIMVGKLIDVEFEIQNKIKGA